MTNSSLGNEGVQLPLVWDEGETVAVYIANQFSLTGTAQQEFFLTVGRVVPPVTVGESPTERMAQLEKLGYITVRTLARYSMNETRLQELHNLLGALINTLDAETP